MANRHTDYISAVREANRQVWDGINTLKALQREWQALDYGNTLPDGEGGERGVHECRNRGGGVRNN